MDLHILWHLTHILCSTNHTKQCLVDIRQTGDSVKISYFKLCDGCAKMAVILHFSSTTASSILSKLGGKQKLMIVNLVGVSGSNENCKNCVARQMHGQTII